jgi:hypothetical protein
MQQHKDESKVQTPSTNEPLVKEPEIKLRNDLNSFDCVILLADLLIQSWNRWLLLLLLDQ